MGVRVTFLCAAVLLALPARAAPLDDAKKEFTAGKEAFERGDYEQALAHYQKANEIVPAASLQYNIGTCHEHLGRYGAAASAFERYLEQSGAPNTDDERDFQDKLRARIAANRKRASDSHPALPPLQPQQPPTTQQPPVIYTPYPNQTPPTYYVPPTPAPPSRELQLQTAKGRRNRAIALMATGLALTVIGIALVADGATDSHSGCTLQATGLTSCHSGLTSAANASEDFFGATFFVIGVTLWAPGAASFVNANNQINTLMREDAAGAPKAFLFHSPTIRF